MQTTRRFLTWAKLNHPREFWALSGAWIEDLCPPRHAQLNTMNVCHAVAGQTLARWHAPEGAR